MENLLCLFLNSDSHSIFSSVITKVLFTGNSYQTPQNSGLLSQTEEIRSLMSSWVFGLYKLKFTQAILTNAWHQAWKVYWKINNWFNLSHGIELLFLVFLICPVIIYEVIAWCCGGIDPLAYLWIERSQLMNISS